MKTRLSGQELGENHDIHRSNIRIICPMSTNNESPTRFEELLQAWNRHQDLRRNDAPVNDLAASRFALDRLRLTV